MLTYRHGLRLKGVMCHRCSAKRDGTVKLEGPRWSIHLDCSHVKTAGWTMPPEELRKRGLVQTQTPIDPRAVSKKRQEQEDKERAIREHEEFVRKNDGFTRSRYYTK